MKTNGNRKNILAVIDANINRAKEGLRVSEDITRFILASKPLSSGLKSIRHAIDAGSAQICSDYSVLLKNRDSAADVGRRIKNKNEFKRRGTKDILISNFKRIEESLRVLEEISKMTDISVSGKFKELRYRTYEMEKAIILYHDKIFRNKGAFK